MAQIKKKFIGNNEVGAAKIRLENASYLRARNAANSADVNILRLNASDVAEAGVNLDMDNQSIIGVGGFLSEADNTVNVGSSGNRFASVFGVTLDSGASQLNLNSTGSILHNESIEPTTDNTRSLGASGSRYSTVHALEVNAAASQLVLASTNSVQVTNNLVPDADGTRDLGGASLRFDNAFVNQLTNSGGININAQGGNLLLNIDPANRVVIQSNDGTAAVPLRFNDLDDSHYVELRAPNVVTTSVTYQLPPADGSSGQFLQTNGSGVMTWATPASAAPNANKNTFTLVSGDITNQYIDLSYVAITDSIDFVVDGVIQREGADYTVNYTGGAGGNTRITFAGDLATGGAAELVAGDIVVIKALQA